MKKSIPCLLLLLSLSLHAQQFEYSGNVEVIGLISNNDQLPFWLYTNSSSAINSETNFSGTALVTGTYNFEASFIEAGIAGFYRDGRDNELQRRDLYVRFQNNWLKATIGAKKQDTKEDGLSVTNKNFLWSQNARPLPGLILEANNPIKISEIFEVDWGIAHYSLNDDRFVDNTRVHYKRVGLITTFNEKHKLTAQLQHFVQWGGTSPVEGQLPNDFEAFVDVFFAKKRPFVTEDITYNNALGNHLGSFLLDYEFTGGVGIFSVYHEHPFEDGSGTRWANFPDGVWGVFFAPENKKIIASALYEFIDTSSQSGTGVGSGFDNYFSNNLYRSGWTYERNTIGMPFILVDPSIVITDTNTPIISNRAKIHHFGVTGIVKNFEWMLKSTFATHLGTYNNPFDSSLKNWHNYLAVSYKTNKHGIFTAITGADVSNLTDTNIGGGLQYSYSF
ncbi:capsule assembly protein Wzi [Ulvibacter sp. MAR_2010_11]|uniref:capsule assembly Wzi family protein n=1 Tax=Ulvibacter sp. MAR_2010_11 TaxID=1250229 RepID=UPI000C2C7AED|nr:capsule assembly Wzi family protein [Ulvibacter sp. MAR_2010_11]PKA84348.1 capsule assembly protein Wzi [Ulvibacter sp. MAR_2010_11]